jgi:histidyl-tRNA synthetase
MQDINSSHNMSDSWQINQMAQRLADHMRRYGYQLVNLPIIESADTFLVKAGDQIINKLFTFEHRGHQLALRPEFTAAAAYHYVLLHESNLPITRWQFSGYVFEDDPNDTTRNRQRFSIGAELIGMDGPDADAEILSMAAQGLSQANVSGYQMTLGHVGLIRHALSQFKLDNRTERFLLRHLIPLKNPDLGKHFVIEQLDKFLSLSNSTALDDLSPATEENLNTGPGTQRLLNAVFDATQRNMTIMGERTRQEITRRLFHKQKQFSERNQILMAIDFLIECGKIAAPPHEAFQAFLEVITPEDSMLDNIISDWKKMLRLLELYEIPAGRIVIKPDLARSWDYYTGIVFEFSTDEGFHLAGGGRYNELTKLLGSKLNVPAVGFAYYVDEIMSASASRSGSNDYAPPIIIAFSSSASSGIRWAQILREQGLRVALMPEGIFGSSDTVLYANDDGSLRLNERTYQMNEKDVVINDLRRMMP